VRSHLECGVHFWTPQYETDIDILERNATEMIKRLEHLTYEKRLRAGTVQSGEEKTQ